MVDLSAEPSMEDILSSIKRIIAEEGDGGTARPKRAMRSPSPRADQSSFRDDEVLELSDPVSPPETADVRAPRELSPRWDDVSSMPQERGVTDAPASQPSPRDPTIPAGIPSETVVPDQILSVQTAEATRGPLDALSRMIVKPGVAGSDTLEALVREMLRPMLRDWLDAHLPTMVEAMVAREIERITGQTR